MRLCALALAAVAIRASAAQAQDAVGQRIAASAAAAEALQGPLDGTWTLADTRGRTLLVFQITDPPTGALQCAWRDPQGRIGLAACARDGRRLTLRFAGGEATLERGAAWRGMLRESGRTRAVAFRRS